MAMDPSHSYPADYYYPEFLDSRADDPLKSPSSHLQVTTAIDNGTGSSTKISKTSRQPNVTTFKQSSAKSNKTLSTTGFDVVVDHGLPDAGITQALKTDPKKNLVRDPAARNIPRLIVDDSVIQQTIRTPKVITTNTNDDLERTKRMNQINNGKKTPATSHVNEDLKNKLKTPEHIQPYPISYIDNQQAAVDNYWKKEVVIDNEGVVTIEPIQYERETYEGPFGLTRTGAFAYYIIIGIFTLLAGIFLIMTGIFYGQGYPSGSSKTGTLTGLCICGFAFYVGLQLILIGIWHQKYRREHPTLSKKNLTERNDSKTRLKSAMETNEQYKYPYQQPIVDYPSYEYYQNPPYASNVNEKMLLQQPGAATGAAYYDSVVWPSNVEIETQPSSKFFQPMESLYGHQELNRTPTTIMNTSVTVSTTKPSKNDKQGHPKNPVQVKSPKAKFDNLFPNSIVTEQPLPALSKAPETNALIRTIAAQESTATQHPPKRGLTKRNSNRIRPIDRRNRGSPVLGSDDNKRNSHGRRRRRRHSYSSCSTCSSSSNDGYKNGSHFSPQQSLHQTSEPSFISFPVNLPQNNPSKSNIKSKNDARYTNGHEKMNPDNRTTRHDLEDISNLQDKHSEPNSVIRRTVIVERQTTEPNSKTTTNPRTEKIKKPSDNSYTKMPDMHLVTIDEDMYGYENPSEKSKNKTSKSKTPQN